ncbi:MAG TPA: hypothetical protein V6D10_16215 [Trichocoleus sp.]|jgi:hypothetical protein
MAAAIRISFSAFVYLLLLSLGYGSIGWLLAAFQVSKLIWLGTLSITFYVAALGTDALLVAVAWVVSVAMIGAVDKAWISIWNANLPYENAQLWAIGLLVFWFWGLVLTSGLAFARKPVQAIGIPYRHICLTLLILTWLALTAGSMAYHLTVSLPH